MGIIWKDETSYSRDEEDRIPRTFVARVGPIRLAITRKHGLDPTEWFVDFYTRNMEFDYVEGGKDLVEAKRLGLRLVRKKLEEAMAALEKMEK